MAAPITHLASPHYSRQPRSPLAISAPSAAAIATPGATLAGTNGGASNGYRTIMVPMQVPLQNPSSPQSHAARHFHHHNQQQQHHQPQPQAQPQGYRALQSHHHSHNHSHNHNLNLNLSHPHSHTHTHTQHLQQFEYEYEHQLRQRQRQLAMSRHPQHLAPTAASSAPHFSYHPKYVYNGARWMPTSARGPAIHTTAPPTPAHRPCVQTSSSYAESPGKEHVSHFVPKNQASHEPKPGAEEHGGHDELVAANALMNLKPTGKASTSEARSAHVTPNHRPATTGRPQLFRPIRSEQPAAVGTPTSAFAPATTPTHAPSSSSLLPPKHAHSYLSTKEGQHRQGRVTPSFSFESPQTHRPLSYSYRNEYASDVPSVVESDMDSPPPTPSTLASLHTAATLPASPTAKASAENPEWHTGSTSLALPEDEDVLSPLHCFMRRYCVEAFAATVDDIATPRYGKSHGVKVVVGQVGIRCVYCKHRPSNNRPERAVCFPSALRNIYHSIETWQRRHSVVCPHIAPWVKKNMTQLMESSKSRAGGRRKYWEDSARRLGMGDTPIGVRFIRTPGALPAIPKSMSPAAATTSSAGSKAHPALADQISKQPSAPVVEPEDRQLITDYLFLLMDQMQTCSFTEEDRSGGRSKVKSNPVGFPGIMCKHCHGKAGFGRYFPTSAGALALANSDRNIHNHIKKCRKCPPKIKEDLAHLAKSEVTKKNRRGLRKLFFRRVWQRVHGEEDK